jgi:hypothetical protein
MRARKFIASIVVAASLAACAITDQSEPSGPAITQDISFVGGCWEQHGSGHAVFLRLLRDREHPGGFSGELTRTRDDGVASHARWTFAPGGTGAQWASLDGMADELTNYVPAPDLPAGDRLSELDERAAYFWERPGQLFLKVTRKGDFLRLARLPATGSQERYAHAGGVYFEGRLSGCD